MPKPLGAEYEGEHERQGWRADNIKIPEFVASPDATPEEAAAARQKYDANVAARLARARNSPALVTKRFTDEERKKNELSVDEDGRVVDAAGKRLNTGGETEYVMDAEKGKLYQFDGNSAEKTNKIVPNTAGRMVNQVQANHHSSVLGGAEVAGAGGMTIVDGKVQQVTNLSGHYKPGIGQTVQTVETLLKQGALLNKEWVDKDGQPLAGKVEELHQRCKAMQQKVAAKLAADPDADVAADRKSVDAAMAMLAKLGAGPRNSISDATVGMLDIKPGMTGAEIHDEAKNVKKNAVPVEEFLRSGGGNEDQAEAQRQMQAELSKKLAGTRAELDRTAKTGEGIADPSDDKLADAARNLAARGAALPGDPIPVSQNRGGDDSAAAGGKNYEAILMSEEDAPSTGGATRYGANPMGEDSPETGDPGGAPAGSAGGSKYQTHVMEDAPNTDGSGGNKYQAAALKEDAPNTDDPGNASGSKYQSTPLDEDAPDTDRSGNASGSRYQTHAMEDAPDPGGSRYQKTALEGDAPDTDDSNNNAGKTKYGENPMGENVSDTDDPDHPAEGTTSRAA